MTIPIYILHGWAIDPQNRTKWQTVVDGLEKDGYIVHFVSMPGFGEVEIHKAWELQDYVKWLAEVVQKAKEQKIVLIGHSFGGQVAVRFTREFPELVEKLILIDSSGIRPFTVRAKFKRVIFHTLAKVGKVIFPGEKGRFLLHKLARERDYLQAPPLMRETMKNVLADEVLEDLPHIQAQTLIIWGELDLASPVTHAHLFKEGIAESTLEFIPLARHSPQYTHPDQVVEKIVSFMERK